MTMTTTKMQLAACHVRKFRWNPPLSFPPRSLQASPVCEALQYIYIYIYSNRLWYLVNLFMLIIIFFSYCQNASEGSEQSTNHFLRSFCSWSQRSKEQRHLRIFKASSSERFKTFQKPLTIPVYSHSLPRKVPHIFRVGLASAGASVLTFSSGELLQRSCSSLSSFIYWNWGRNIAHAWYNHWSWRV